MTRRLILSPFYQRLWGSRFTFRDDQNTKVQVDNSQGGSRLATSVGGTLLGIGGDVLVVDDPHNVAQAESEAERETVSNWWSELSTTRLNDPKQSAIVVIMQRLHESDVSGTILSGDEDWCHLMIPMEYDWRRHCSTSLGWNDPRGLDDDGIPLVENGLPCDAEAAVELDDRNGALMWPERFGELMSRIDCRGGQTQIAKIFTHARRENDRHKVAALVFVGEAMEEMLDELCAGAGLSITHNSCADRGAQPDIGETGQAAPHHDVPRRRIIGAREVSA